MVLDYRWVSKIQLKRKMLNQDGKTAFLKQTNKMLKDVSDLDQDKMDDIITASLTYAREEMQRNECICGI